MKKNKILIIEDSIDLCQLWEKLFSSSGCEVTYCLDGKSAIETLKNITPPDVILCDYYLPDMTGLAVVEQVRVLTPNVPVVFVTGSREKMIQDKINILPNSKIIFKPIKFKELQKVTEEMLSKH